MINSISNNIKTYAKNEIKQDKKETKQKTETKQENDGVVYEASKEKISEQDRKIDAYKEKQNIDAMLKQAELQTKNFEKLVSSMFDKQANKFSLVTKFETGGLKEFYKNLTVDAKTIAKAKEDISEDGYYGVKQTSERIVSFAKAVAGNDPKKLEEMRNAVEKGFKQAENMWGGELPEISKQTYDKVMDTFDELQGIKKEEKKEA